VETLVRQANGLDMSCIEAGDGETLVLLHGGTLSNSPVWVGHPLQFSILPEIPTFAESYRIVAPDLRGHGKTINPDGPFAYDVYADDIAALIESLDVGPVRLWGFSDGGMTATIVALRFPHLVSALVNHGGTDTFNHDSPTPTIMRRFIGGNESATEANLDALEKNVAMFPGLRSCHEADHDASQGPGAWQRLFFEGFERWTHHLSYRLDDFARIEVPMLISVGDRDSFCTVEESCAAYRNLPHGELSIIPGIGHAMTPAVAAAALDFFARNS